jgi:hypothetical protein
MHRGSLRVAAALPDAGTGREPITRPRTLAARPQLASRDWSLRCSQSFIGCGPVAPRPHRHYARCSPASGGSATTRLTRSQPSHAIEFLRAALIRHGALPDRDEISELISRQLADLRLAVMMLDGLELKGRMMIVALGITTEGVKIPLGLWEGSTENATVATALLSDLVERGLDPEQGMLFVLDGIKALRKAVRSVFGGVPVQRCIRHRSETVIKHLPERDRPPIKARMRTAWRETDYPRALEQLQRLAAELEHTHPGAAASLWEGMDETLTVIRLGINGKLERTLESTSPAEVPASSALTRERVGWQPTHPGLIDDLDQGHTPETPARSGYRSRRTVRP